LDDFRSHTLDGTLAGDSRAGKRLDVEYFVANMTARYHLHIAGEQLQTFDSFEDAITAYNEVG
jgi:hypothetical protein